MPFPSQEQFQEKIKVADLLVGMATPGAGDSEGDSWCTVRGRGQDGRESRSAVTGSPESNNRPDPED